MPLELLGRPNFVRLMLAFVLAILPLLTWIDYRNGYHVAATIDVLAGLTLAALVIWVRHIGPLRVARLALILLFVLAAGGSLDKLDSLPNLAWLPVMPVLYVFLGGPNYGGALTIVHYLTIAAGIVLLPDAAVPVDSSAWLQVSLAYWTAAMLAVSYESLQQHLINRLRGLAEHDQLTGLLNRHGMEKRLLEFADFLSRHEIVVTFAIVDIDHFKRVNDEHGHQVGDMILAGISREFVDSVRSSDYVARWGGEEFLFALNRTGMADGADVLERLRARVAENPNLPVTLSIGVAEWRPGEDLDAALRRADDALYVAKHGGRNRLASLNKPNPDSSSGMLADLQPA